MMYFLREIYEIFLFLLALLMWRRFILIISFSFILRVLRFSRLCRLIFSLMIFISAFFIHWNFIFSLSFFRLFLIFVFLRCFSHFIFDISSFRFLLMASFHFSDYLCRNFFRLFYASFSFISIIFDFPPFSWWIDDFSFLFFSWRVIFFSRYFRHYRGALSSLLYM